MGDIVRVPKPGTVLSARPGPPAKGTTTAGDDLGSLLGGLLGGGGGAGQAADQIAQNLPQAVDRLTPGGEIPSGSIEDIIRQQQF